jgi:hypothetical protein
VDNANIDCINVISSEFSLSVSLRLLERLVAAHDMPMSQLKWQRSKFPSISVTKPAVIVVM